MLDYVKHQIWEEEAIDIGKEGGSTIAAGHTWAEGLENAMANMVVWADLPVKDMARARAFYSKLLGYPIEEWPDTNGGLAMLMPPGESMSDVGGDLTMGGPTEPSSTQGAVVYLGTNGDMDGMLKRAVEAGGSVFKDKQDMGDMGGWLAYIIDSEGNLVGLQQPSK